MIQVCVCILLRSHHDENTEADGNRKSQRPLHGLFPPVKEDKNKSWAIGAPPSLFSPFSLPQALLPPVVYLSSLSVEY
jgi:hypothetical protein